MANDAPQLTTGEVAKRLVLNETTVINYAKQGLLRATRTAGGHRRYPAASVEELQRVLAMPDGEARTQAMEALRRRNGTTA
ncbi:MerR family DNA-binding transcriptional regulator [Micromonospora sp. C51]|uniref:MerR family DNA-binding transcriptional regulator n=1 Tax=Micromonospora sp. C51 TaxID=2824879 RepID=UPI001B37C3DB|nr:MerR family DNA-binding transcriptional regulator [Micromonospora sp. C51]MBQ1048492.1 MerR family DNA-binding transcriptional regulator [Micromonospora sp. C51]